jgi:hypothetical protein
MNGTSSRGDQLLYMFPSLNKHTSMALSIASTCPERTRVQAGVTSEERGNW